MPASAQVFYYPVAIDPISGPPVNDPPAATPLEPDQTNTTVSTPPPSDSSGGSTSNSGGQTNSTISSQPVSSTPVASTPVSSSPVISGPPVSGMVLTFDDEFNSLSASSSGQGATWETKFYYDSIMHSNWDNFDLDPAVCGLGLTPYEISDGVLHIHEQTTDPRLTACGVTEPYTSGNLYSYYSFSQEYGYFETRAKASNAYGSIFAFWMIPKDGSWPPEIDMPEILGREPTVDHVSNHTGANNDTISFPVTPGPDLSADFHTYGVLWNDESITYFFDGTPVAKTSTGPDEHKPFYLIIGLGVGACGDGWADCPKDPGNFSADAYVDYVRVWQYADQNPAACIGDCTAATP
jgi:hypothetical protein